MSPRDVARRRAGGKRGVTGGCEQLDFRRGPIGYAAKPRRASHLTDDAPRWAGAVQDDAVHQSRSRDMTAQLSLADHRARPRSLRRVRQLERRHHPAAGRRFGDRLRQPAAGG